MNKAAQGGTMPTKKVFEECGTLTWIPIGKLNIDSRYQRNLNRSWARKIADNFDPDLFGFLVVNQRKDGTFWVIDGQQRLSSVRDFLKWGDDQELPCILIRRDGAKNEAKEFTGINDQRLGVRPTDSFIARIVAEEPVAVNIKKIIEECGLEIGRGSRDGAIAATKACEFVYFGAKGAANGRVKEGAYPWLLRDTLHVILAAWGDEKLALSSTIIKAVGQILRHVQTIDKTRLITAMSKVSPASIRVDARLKSRFDNMSSTASTADLIISYYNKGLRSNKIGSWRDIINQKKV